jgi:tetratricopeptide (TPR) repeat protein
MRIRTVARLAVICFVVSASVNLFAQQLSPLELKIETNKTKYLVGEPIYLWLVIKNTSGKFQQFSSELSYVSDFELNVIKPEELPKRYIATMKPGLYPQVVYEMWPGDQKKVDYTILYDDGAQNGLLFDKPQRAKLSCKLAYNIADVYPHRFYFPNIDIEIVAPSGEDAEALKLLLQKNIIFDLHRGFATEQTKPVLQELLQKYPKSTYAALALYTLAGGEILPQNPTQNYEKAIELYKKVISDYPNFPPMDYVYYRIAGCYDKIAKEKDKSALSDDTNRWLIKIWNEFPQSSRIRKNDPLFKEYIFDKQVKANPLTWSMH